MTDYPITPPPELVEQWFLSSRAMPVNQWVTNVAAQAARWGADQELEACCAWLSVPCPSYGRELRAARRPKPPSLAEQALKITGYPKDFWSEDEVKTIRRALERLQELEGFND